MGIGTMPTLASTAALSSGYFSSLEPEAGSRERRNPCFHLLLRKVGVALSSSDSRENPMHFNSFAVLLLNPTYTAKNSQHEREKKS